MFSGKYNNTQSQINDLNFVQFILLWCIFSIHIYRYRLHTFTVMYQNVFPIWVLVTNHDPNVYTTAFENFSRLVYPLKKINFQKQSGHVARWRQLAQQGTKCSLFFVVCCETRSFAATKQRKIVFFLNRWGLAVFLIWVALPVWKLLLHITAALNR